MCAGHAANLNAFNSALAEIDRARDYVVMPEHTHLLDRESSAASAIDGDTSSKTRLCTAVFGRATSAMPPVLVGLS